MISPKTRLITAVLAAFILASGFLYGADKKSVKQDQLERRQKVELMSFFLKDPKDAELPKTTLGINLFNQAVEYYQKGEFALAKQTLKDSLAQDDQNAYAYELLGDIYNNQQDLKEARANYQIAYNLQPTDALRKKIEILGKEAIVEKKLSTYKEEHFIIKYHNQEKQFEGFELREILRQTYRGISQDFGYYFSRQVVVLLLDEEEFKEISNTPHWAGGVYDGKIRLPVKRFGFSETDLKALSAHEVTHAFVAAISAQQAPAWLNEGLAVYQEDKIKKTDMLIFNAAIKTQTVFPLDQLMNENSLTTRQDALWVNLFYQESFHLVTYLVKRYGMFNVKKMLTEFSKGKDSDEVIRTVLQIPMTRLEKEWRATFTKP